MSDFLNNAHKYVASDTLDKLDWGPASRVTGDLDQELRKLKRQPGKNIQIPGSPTLVRSLLRDGLLDELSLSICPVVVGPGLRLFEDLADQLPLKVAHATILSNGVVNVTYEPATADQASPQPSIATFLLEHSVVVPAELDGATTEAARAWLSDSWELVHPSGSGGVYGNFPDADLPDEHRAYWGANLERVRRVKEKYDPEGVFG
jgi:RibD C-terminal domain/Berberine and berberine like